MSEEYVAAQIADAIENAAPDTRVIDDPAEDMRSGGYFFDVEFMGARFEVLVRGVA